MLKPIEIAKTKCGNNIELYANNNYAPVLVIGCFHGDEPQGNYLIKKYLEQKPLTKLIFIPCLNPDGMLNRTRTNSNGVDLNRNFATKNWKLSIKDDYYYGGEKPESELETVFIKKIVEKYSPKLIISLHAPYKVVNYDGDAELIAEKISNIIHYPVEKSIGYPTPGSFGTWAGVERNIPIITLELDEKIQIKELENPVFNIFEMLETLYR